MNIRGKKEYGVFNEDILFFLTNQLPPLLINWRYHIHQGRNLTELSLAITY